MFEFLLSWTGLFMYWIPMSIVFSKFICDIINIIKYDIHNRKTNGSYYRPTLTIGDLMVSIFVGVIFTFIPLLNIVVMCMAIGTWIAPWFNKPLIKPNN